MNEKKKRRSISFAEKLMAMEARISLAEQRAEELRVARDSMIADHKAKAEAMLAEVNGDA